MTLDKQNFAFLLLQLELLQLELLQLELLQLGLLHWRGIAVLTKNLLLFCYFPANLQPTIQAQKFVYLKSSVVYFLKSIKSH
jgi:hypothetical protein